MSLVDPVDGWDSPLYLYHNSVTYITRSPNVLNALKKIAKFLSYLSSKEIRTCGDVGGYLDIRGRRGKFGQPRDRHRIGKPRVRREGRRDNGDDGDIKGTTGRQGGQRGYMEAARGTARTTVPDLDPHFLLSLKMFRVHCPIWNITS